MSRLPQRRRGRHKLRTRLRRAGRRRRLSRHLRGEALNRGRMRSHRLQCDRRWTASVVPPCKSLTFGSTARVPRFKRDPPSAQSARLQVAPTACRSSHSTVGARRPSDDPCGPTGAQQNLIAPAGSARRWTMIDNAMLNSARSPKDEPWSSIPEGYKRRTPHYGRASSSVQALPRSARKSVVHPHKIDAARGHYRLLQVVSNC